MKKVIINILKWGILALCLSSCLKDDDVFDPWYVCDYNSFAMQMRLDGDVLVYSNGYRALSGRALTTGEYPSFATTITLAPDGRTEPLSTVKMTLSFSDKKSFTASVTEQDSREVTFPATMEFTAGRPLDRNMDGKYDKDDKMHNY